MTMKLPFYDRNGKMEKIKSVFAGKNGEDK